MIRPAVALVLCLTLGACEQTEPKSDARSDADAVMLKDIQLAGTELERRLTASVRNQDGLIVTHELGDASYYDYYLLSANSSWAISCGFGLSVVLGNYVSRDGNEIKIQLTDTLIDPRDCAVLGPRLGKRLNAILQGDQSAPR
jgi:hypothetical protein